ncbi:hypothetical protein GOBAR_DD28933 [Gossypium barbadense]|nr:hypothetical protein GOBAR_DD28933 [Gossypium barbadense]
MSRIRGAHGQLVPRCLLRECTSKVLIKVNFFTCTTKNEEMSRAMRVRGIQIPNFSYEFSIPEGSYRLNDTSDGSFFLPFYTLKAKCHLSLHPFFYHFLQEYQIAPGQLCGFSWWIAMAYFIDCCHHNQAPQLEVF